MLLDIDNNATLIVTSALLLQFMFDRYVSDYNYC